MHFAKRWTLNHLMAQWVDMEALKTKNHSSLSCFLTLWAQFDKWVVSYQHHVGWSRTDMRSVRDFSASMSTHWRIRRVNSNFLRLGILGAQRQQGYFPSNYVKEHNQSEPQSFDLLNKILTQNELQLQSRYQLVPIETEGQDYLIIRDGNQAHGQLQLKRFSHGNDRKYLFKFSFWRKIPEYFSRW